MFSEIEEKFYAFQPNICVNEGGDISQKNIFQKRCYTKDGEIGLTKIMADSLKIKTINGDPNVEFEFNELLKTYSKGEFLAYIVTERLMWSLIGEKISQEKEIEKRYTEFIENYIIKKGKVILTLEEKILVFINSII